MLRHARPNGALCVKRIKEEHKGMQGTLVTLLPPSPERCPYRGRPVLRNTLNACPVSSGIYTSYRRLIGERMMAACGVAVVVKNRVLALFRRLQIVQKHYVRGFAESYAGSDCAKPYLDEAPFACVASYVELKKIYRKHVCSPQPLLAAWPGSSTVA